MRRQKLTGGGGGESNGWRARERDEDEDEDLGNVLLLSEDDEAGPATNLDSGKPTHLFEAAPSKPSRSPIRYDPPSPTCLAETDGVEAAVSAALQNQAKVFQRQMDAAVLRQTVHLKVASMRDAEQSQSEL